MPRSNQHLFSRQALVRRTCLGLLTSVSVVLLGACATGRAGSGVSGGGAGAGGAAGVKNPDTAARAIGPSVLMRCGKQEVAVRANAEQAELTVGGKRYLLQAQRSASGARYASSAYPGTSFWSKGDRGMLALEGQAHPECSTMAAAPATVSEVAGGPPRDLTVREWVVQSMDGRGVIDNSRSTLTFDPKGQIAGRAGCNRFTGVYQLQGTRIEVKGVATTRMICVPALMEQEARFLKALASVTTWLIQPDGRLELAGPNGVRLLAR
jgi:heat shock protein HslJ